MGMKIGRKVRMDHVEVSWPNQIEIGDESIIEHNVYFKYDGSWKSNRSIIIKNNVFIGNNCEFNIKESVTIGNNCLIGAGSRFVDHDHGINLSDPIRKQYCPRKSIELKEDVWVGANCLILKGVKIDTGAIVAGGSVVTKSIPAFEIWAGIPAKKIGYRK